jgi:hypothetical protein
MPERTKTEQEDRDKTDSLTDLIRTGAQPDRCPAADCPGTESGGG